MIDPSSKYQSNDFSKYTLVFKDKNLSKKYHVGRINSNITKLRIYFICTLILYVSFYLSRYLLSSDSSMNYNFYTNLAMILIFFFDCLFMLTDYYEKNYYKLTTIVI